MNLKNIFKPGKQSSKNKRKICISNLFGYYDTDVNNELQYLHRKNDVYRYFRFGRYSFSGKFSHTGEIVMVVIKPFQVLNYLTSQLYTIAKGSILYICSALQYIEDSEIMMITLDEKTTDTSEMYVASVKELNAYTVPVYELSHEYCFICPFEINEWTKFFNKFQYKELFSTNNIDVDWTLKFVPLLGIIQEFLIYQDNNIYSYFLNNFLDILNDAKCMLNSNISKDDKYKLLAETEKVMLKLRDTVDSVSPYNSSSIPYVIDAIDLYKERLSVMAKEEEEKKKEERILEEEKRRKIEEEKEKYIRKITSKSQLIDYFNT